MINKNLKGKRGEYEVRDILKKKFYPEGDGTVVRTPMSGAWDGMPVLSGDLIFLRNGQADTRFPFFWEVKLRKKKALAPYQILGGNFGPLDKWWKEAEGKCAAGPHGPRVIPLIVWRTDFSPWFIFMSLVDFDVMAEWFDSVAKRMTILRTRERVNMLLEDWLGWMKLECFQ